MRGFCPSLVSCSRATAFNAKSFRLPTAAEPPFSVWPEKRGPKRGHPASALSGPPARKVRESGPGFSSGLLPARKGVAILGNARYAACRPRLAAAEGPRVEQWAIPARTRCATAARLRELKAVKPNLRIGLEASLFCCFGCLLRNRSEFQVCEVDTCRYAGLRLSVGQELARQTGLTGIADYSTGPDFILTRQLAFDQMPAHMYEFHVSHAIFQRSDRRDE